MFGGAAAQANTLWRYSSTRCARPGAPRSTRFSLLGVTIATGLRRAIEDLRAGDTLVVWRLDRLGRSLRDLLDISEMLRAATSRGDR